MEARDEKSDGPPTGIKAIAGKKRRLRRRIVLLVLLSPFLAAAIGYVVVRVSNANAVSRLENEIRQQGEPLTLTELQASYLPIPDDQNAAAGLLTLWKKENPVFWKALLSGAQSLAPPKPKSYPPNLPFFGSNARSLAPGEAMDAESFAAAKEYLRQEAEHLQGAHAALQRPKARFPLDLTNGLSMLLPQGAWLQDETRHFCLAARVAAQEGHPEQAIASLRNAVRSAQTLANEPVVLSQLYRHADLQLTIGGVEDLLSRPGLTALQLDQVKGLFDEMKAAGALKRCLIGERADDLSLFDSNGRNAAAVLGWPGAGNGSSGSSIRARLAMSAFKLLGLAGADERLILETFQQAIAVGDADTPQAIKKFNDAFRNASIKAQHFPPKIFSAKLLPMLGKLAPAFADLEAKRRAGLVSVAIEQYRLEHDGQLPTSLDRLVPNFLPAIPPDPYDGKPLRLRRLKQGYVVYSVGSDGKDDGGQRSGRRNTQRKDVTFSVLR